MMKFSKSSTKVVWTYGAIPGTIAGICLGILPIIPLEYAPAGLIHNILVIVLPIVTLLLAGMLASKQTGRVRTGSLAGLVAALTGGIIAWAGFWVAVQMGHMGLSWGLTREVNTLLPETLSFVFLLGIGAGIGTLGGLVGKRKAKVPPAGDPMYTPCSLQQQIIQQQQ